MQRGVSFIRGDGYCGPGGRGRPPPAGSGRSSDRADAEHRSERTHRPTTVPARLRPARARVLCGGGNRNVEGPTALSAPGHLRQAQRVRREKAARPTAYVGRKAVWASKFRDHDILDLTQTLLVHGLCFFHTEILFLKSRSAFLKRNS